MQNLKECQPECGIGITRGWKEREIKGSWIMGIKIDRRISSGVVSTPDCYNSQ
jgi:hypothetical protein